MATHETTTPSGPPLSDPVTIGRLETIQDFRQCEVLQHSIWGADPVEVTPADMLMTIHRHGGVSGRQWD